MHWLPIIISFIAISNMWPKCCTNPGWQQCFKGSFSTWVHKATSIIFDLSKNNLNFIQIMLSKMCLLHYFDCRGMDFLWFSLLSLRGCWAAFCRIRKDCALLTIIMNELRYISWTWTVLIFIKFLDCNKCVHHSFGK